MQRSEFLARMASGAYTVSAADVVAADGPFASTEVEIERAEAGQPHAGKMLAAIQPHGDDLPIFAGGGGGYCSVVFT